MNEVDNFFLLFNCFVSRRDLKKVTAYVCFFDIIASLPQEERVSEHVLYHHSMKKKFLMKNSST